MPRALLLVVSIVVAGLAAPAVASACCADFDEHSPAGWSADGHLLVETFVSSDCEGTRTLDVMSPGRDAPVTRFDRYDASRRLAPGATPRTVDETELWQMEEAGDGGALFPLPESIRRRFSTPIRSIDGADVLAVAHADPADSLSSLRWESNVIVDVALRADAGFVEIASGIQLDHFTAENASVRVLPVPGSNRALLHISYSHSEAQGDELHWISLPEGAPRATRGGDVPALVIPLRDNLLDPEIEQGNYHVESALRAQADLVDASDDESRAESRAWLLRSLTQALWSDPESDVIRAALVDALEGAGAAAVAAEVGAELTTGPLAPLATLAPSPSPSPFAQGSDPALAARGGSLEELPGWGGDAAVEWPTATDPEPPAEAVSCDATGGTSTALALLSPAFVLALGLGLGAMRRRRR